MHRGYVKLWRKMLDSAVITNSTAVQVFVYILIKTAWEPVKKTVSGDKVSLQAGQMIFTFRNASEDLNQGIQKIRTAIALLKRKNVIFLQPTRDYTIISVINWGTYQGIDNNDNTPSNTSLTRPQHTPNTSLTHLKELEEVKKELEALKEQLLNPKVKRFVPPSIEEVTAYCLERGKGVCPETWIDHYTSNGWKVGKNAMKDWKAAVRTWERNSHSKPSTGRKQTHADRVNSAVFPKMDISQNPEDFFK